MSIAAKENLSIGRWSEILSFRKVIVSVFILRVLASIVGLVYPLGGPHQWRQSDTMGMAMRFWSRWVLEPSHSYPLLGAVIQSGDFQGVVNSELPLLPLLTAPAFGLGVVLGRQVAQAILLLLVLALLGLCYRIWRSFEFRGVKGGDLVLLTPFFSFAAPFFSKFIPDLLAMLLCFSALGLIIQARDKVSIPAIVLATFGLLLKPTSIITFFPLILVLMSWRQFRLKWLLYSSPILIAALYFGPFNGWVDTLRDGKNIFRSSIRPPWENILSVLSDLDGLQSCLNYHLFFPFGIGVAITALILKGKQIRSFLILDHWAAPFFGIVAMQVLFILLVDGNHAFTHVYYFIGVAPLAAGLFLTLWRTANQSVLVKVILALLLLGRNFEIGATEVRTIFREGGPRDHFNECEQLRVAHPEVPWEQGLVFRSPGEDFSFLAVCFGERDMSTTAPWGFIELDKLIHMPSECSIIDQRNYVGLMHCSNGNNIDTLR